MSTKSKSKKPQKNNALPTWDLTHLVALPSKPNIEKSLKALSARAQKFQKTYQHKLGKIPVPAFVRALMAYEEISAEMGRVYSYASLDRQTKMNDPAAAQLYQTVFEQANDMTTMLLFFRLEVNKIPDAKLKQLMKDKAVARYKPFLDNMRAFRPYQLADDVEKAVHERSVVGHPAWSRLFDETCAQLRFPVEGKMLTETEAFHRMFSPKPQQRKAAAQAIEGVFSKNISTFALILNTIAKEKEVDDRQRGFQDPVSSRNLENQVEDDVVQALVESVRAAYPRLSHRYYRLKAKWLGLKKMNYWDRNAPLPFSSPKKFSWGQAQGIVLQAYHDFHPDMAKIARRFFDEKWIDAAPRAGKDSGAFSAATVPSVHPYILMNFKGGVEDVMTLAHELGHGIHQVLASKQGYLMADTPLTLAETASVFGEMLTFQSLLRVEKDPLLRRAIIAKKVEDMLNTVVRQIAFHTFETRVHAARRKGELTPDHLGEIWMTVMKESLGPAFDFTDGYKFFWAYIGHFYHVPFYVYAYAFGDCLVNSLYAVYQKEGKGFESKYLELLAAGGTKRHDALLKPFGLNAKDPTFWKQGLGIIEKMIDQLESAEKTAKSFKG